MCLGRVNRDSTNYQNPRSRSVMYVGLKTINFYNAKILFEEIADYSFESIALQRLRALP